MSFPYKRAFINVSFRFGRVVKIIKLAITDMMTEMANVVCPSCHALIVENPVMDKSSSAIFIFSYNSPGCFCIVLFEKEVFNARNRLNLEVSLERSRS